MPIDAVLLSDLLHAPPRMSLYVAIDALPMPDTMNYRWCLLAGGRLRVCADMFPLLCRDLAVSLLGADFSFPAVLSQLFFLDSRTYAACFHSLIFLLVASLEGSVIDQVGGNLAWPRKSLDTIRIQRSLHIRTVLSPKDMEAVDIGKHLLKGPRNCHGSGDDTRIRPSEDNLSS